MYSHNYVDMCVYEVIRRSHAQYKIMHNILCMHVCMYIIISIHVHVYQILVNADCVYIALLPRLWWSSHTSQIYLSLKLTLEQQCTVEVKKKLMWRNRSTQQLYRVYIGPNTMQ